MISAFSTSILNLRYGQPELKEYFITYPSERFSKVYSLIDVNIELDLKNPSMLSMTRIPLEFGGYGFQKVWNNNLKLNIKMDDNSTYKLIEDITKLEPDKIKELGMYGFTHYKLDEKRKILFLYFDRSNSTLKDIKKIVMEGLILKEESERYLFDDHIRHCDKDICYAKVEIKTDLEKTVKQDNETIYNLKEKDGKCIFTDLSYESSIKPFEISLDCKSNSCLFELYDEQKPRNQFLYIESRIDDGNIVEMSYVEISEPLEINLTYWIKCS